MFPKYVLKTVIGAGIAAVTFLLYFYNPADIRNFPKCPLLWLTGLKCPGCGTLRAIHYSLNGDFLTAVQLNPILLLAIPLLIVLFVIPSFKRSRICSLAVFGVVMVYWVMRNVFGF